MTFQQQHYSNSPMSDASEDGGPDPLQLDSLDPESLRTALLNVEKAIPELLLEIKPILAYLGATHDDEKLKQGSHEAVARYLATLDSIQYILRNAAYYLREIRASPSVLKPPAADAIPRPLAATLRDIKPGGSEAQLGLYAQRQEVKALEEMLGALRGIRRDKGDGEREGEKEG